LLILLYEMLIPTLIYLQLIRIRQCCYLIIGRIWHLFFFFVIHLRQQFVLQHFIITIVIMVTTSVQYDDSMC